MKRQQACLIRCMQLRSKPYRIRDIQELYYKIKSIRIVIHLAKSLDATRRIRIQRTLRVSVKLYITSPQEFQNCFEQRQKRCDKCLDAHGQYFREETYAFNRNAKWKRITKKKIQLFLGFPTYTFLRDSSAIWIFVYYMDLVF
ncbi:hypothetical protein TNCV_4578151 [Trichonephila clavipes]|nr:hypothetical protein TNCV_4578151 [Trichonephila clavipes]